jgi:DNA-directed RNA polymerase specialized sigma24 family protein
MPQRPAAICANLIQSEADPAKPKDIVGDRGPEATAGEWLESPYLHRLIQRVAYQHGLTSEELQDLLQEMRIALWKAGLTIPVTPAWIARTASHKAVDLVRADIRRRAQDSYVACVSLSRTRPDAEIERLLHARVDEMPARLRSFYELHYHQGFSEREIARSLGLCRSSVRWLDRCCLRYISGEGSTRTVPIRKGDLPAPGVH